MRQHCEKCGRRYDDEFHLTSCPHKGLGYCAVCDCVICVCDPKYTRDWERSSNNNAPSTDERSNTMESNFIEEVGWPQVHGETSSVKFTVQSGPIKEFGVNGCQIDDVIEWAKKKVEEFSKAFPCRENSMVVTKLDEALLWSAKRRTDREKRGVEGTSKL